MTGLLVAPIVLAGTVAWVLARPRGGPSQSLPPRFAPIVARVDRAAPDFELPLLVGGDALRLSGLREPVVVLNFWASWCPPCKQEAPELEAVWNTYRARGVQFLGVDFRDSRSDGVQFERRYGITYPSVSDPGGTLESPYRLIGLPTTFVIDHGRIRFQVTGKTDRKQLGAILDSVLRGGPSPAP